MPYLLKPDGSRVDLPDAKISLEEAQEHVNGYVEVVRCRGGETLLVNEEGRLRGLQMNLLASKFYGGIIAGNAVVFEKGERPLGWR